MTPDESALVDLADEVAEVTDTPPERVLDTFLDLVERDRAARGGDAPSPAAAERNGGGLR